MPTARLIGVFLAALLVGLFVSGLPEQVAYAAPIGVTTTDDELDGLEGNGSCSLREAISNANNNDQGQVDCAAGSGADEIIIPAGTYTITRRVGEQEQWEDRNVTGDFDILDHLTIRGAGAGQTILDGANIDRLLHMRGAITVRVADLTITNGRARSHNDCESPALVCGGGILAGNYLSSAARVDLHLERVAITGNGAHGGQAARGGGIALNGTGTIVDSTISGNTAGAVGGGLVLAQGEVTIVNSTISGNSASVAGAALFHSSGGPTISLVNVTVANNSGASAVRASSGFAVVNLTNSVLAGNTGANCLGNVTSAGHNVSDDLSCPLGNNDVRTTGAVVAALADNGGPTMTHALLPGSPAVDNGNRTTCETAMPAGSGPTDQRGTGFSRIRSVTCDSGAFEVQADVDVSLTKTGTIGEIPAGTSASFQIIVSASGIEAASGVQVTDTFPAGLTDISWTSQASGGATGNTASGTENINDTLSLPIGASVVYSISATVPPEWLGDITNTATLTHPAADLNPDNNSANHTIAVTAVAGLSLSKTADAPADLLAGDPLSYRLQVANAGPSDATGVTVTDALPAGVTYVSNDCGAPAPVGGELTWSVGTLAVGADAACTIMVLAPETGGSFTNAATVSSAAVDTDASDNTASASVTARSEADLSLAKSASVAEVLVGDPFTYTLRVENAGPTLALGVVVSDTLPAGVTFVSNSCGASAPTDGVFTWSIGALANGASASCELTVLAPDARGSIANSATVSATSPDPNPVNDGAGATVLVLMPELVVSKTGPEVAPPATEVVYAITVTNTGDGEAREVVMRDTLVGGSLSSVDAPSGVDCTTSSDTVTCTLEEPLRPGGEVVIWVRTVAPETLGTTGMINRACAETSTPEEETGNNCDEAGTSVVADVPIPPLPVVGPHLYQPEPRPTPSATPSLEPTATATLTPGETATPEPTATATSEPEPIGAAAGEPTEPAATETATPDGDVAGVEATPSATATPVRTAPTPPETGSGGATGSETAAWLMLASSLLIALGGGAMALGRRPAVR